MAAVDLSGKKEEIEALVDRVKKGDHEAFSGLYDLLIDHIYRYVYYRVKSADAEDLVENVFLKVWENIGKYKREKRNLFSAWIFRIAHNVVVDYYRTQKDRDFDELEIDIMSHDREHNPIKRAETTLHSGVLRRALKNLNKNYQDVLIHKFINDFSNQEISEIMRKSEGSLRILQHRALKALKSEMEKMGVKYEF